MRFGFPDFRLGDVPDVDAETDLESARILAAKQDELSFIKLMELHFHRRPAVSAEAQATQLAHFEAEREQAERAIEKLSAAPGDGFLDLGCGMGRYLAAAGARFANAARS